MNGMTYQEIIDKYGGFVYYPVGTSMLPLIREGLDSVKLVAINDNIKKYDVLLYKRNNHQFVLHRVVKVHHDSYDFMGDNQWVIEKNIKRSQIIARMEEVYRQEKTISLTTFNYQIYVRFRVWFRCLRKLKYLIKKRLFKKQDKRTK